ncbi:aminopeptidase P N-terminal domain-containing protein [Polynucleobacter sp. MWH-Spelu-300-X4]|uniref:aminopeptidase P N-terminal domain-containing protein n=1 Tax=Polynucleobacter sp. MWH-Spelu-300-X4 TaxID=2689109 RepID=UPI0035303599
MMNQPFPQDIYAKRRQRLAISMREKSGGGILILETAAEVYRNRDSDFPYRHDSDFYYLTGFNEPGATLVMTVSPKEVHTHLFCRPKDLEREIWDGWRLGPEAAPQYLGLDSAESIEKIDALIPAYIENQRAIYTRMIQGSFDSAQLNQWLKKVKAGARNGSATPEVLFDAEALIHEMRLFKDAHEIDIMRRAGKIAAAGHIRAMQHAKPGLHEYHLEAELLHTFRYNGAQSVAYNTIVAGGANACVLHHRAGHAQLKDGDLCLIDAGCELDGYASDITRTFPVNGKFTGPQKAIYELVLASQYAAIEKTKAGLDFQAPHEAALRVLTQGLMDLGLINKKETADLDNALELKAYQRFYMHRTSHWLGMDVHDVGEYRDPQSSTNPRSWRLLEPGMVLTIEPGLYIRKADDIHADYWDIGIRIEDDALVTNDACDLLSREVPVSIEEIEYLMKQSS